MSQLIYHLGTDFKRINEPESMLIWGAQTYIKRMIASYKNIFDEPVHIPLEPSEYPAWNWQIFFVGYVEMQEILTYD